MIAPLAAITVLVIAGACGARLFQLARQEFSSFGDHLIFSAGLGLYVFAVGVFILGIAGLLHPVIFLFLLAALALLCRRQAYHLLRGVAGWVVELKGGDRSPLQLVLGWMLGTVLLLNGVIALAPLTGSDPMQYHFVFPKLFAKAHSIQPIYWDINSFFLGTPHMLILLGMELGSDRIALALNFGVYLLSVLALWRLSETFLPKRYQILAALLFSVTPMVYWEASSGYIDLWGAFYTILALVAMLTWVREGVVRWLILSGLFAGFSASCKYTLWAVPLFIGAVLIVFLLLKHRSPPERLKVMAGFLLPAAVSGSWVNVRNAVWTGDPFFPFFSDLLGRVEHNQITWEYMRVAPKANGFSLAFSDLILFPGRLILAGEEFSGGHFLGPIVLSFLPLVLALVVRGDAQFRFAMAFCTGFFMLNAVMSQNAHYLLPIYPIMLVMALAGMRSVSSFILTRYVCGGILAVYLVFGVASFAAYSAGFFPVVVGMEREEDFLARKASEYKVVQFVNEVVPRGERVLVFFHHMYYLDGDYIFGGPEYSWAMDFSRITTAEGLKARLETLGVHYLIMDQRYPERVESFFQSVPGIVKEGRDVATLLRSFETCCLDPVARREIWDLKSRRFDRHEPVAVTVFRLR